MRNTQTAAQREIKALRAEVERLQSLAKTKAASVQHDVSNVIGIEDIRDFAKEAGKNARRFIRDTRSQAVDLREDAEGRIASHPFRSVGLAALAGAVFGMLFSSTRR